ncbi:MAG: hypothetical protein JWO99_684 [Candidatus Saccharibacteria bacterium]|nr:hypothetical protein [Candidatus Saccharibacteria bacterium]
MTPGKSNFFGEHKPILFLVSALYTENNSNCGE